MIKTIKKALPIAVFMMLGTGTLLLQLTPSREAILLVGSATASSIALLLYAVIRWDDVHAAQECERRQLADVVGRSTDAILVADSDARILYANTAARVAYGDFQVRGTSTAASTAPGGSTLAILGFDLRHMVEVIGQVLDGGPWHGELTHDGPDGAVHTAFVNLFRLEAFQGAAPVIAVIAHDLTERKALQAELLHSQKLAAVGELSAGLAHEINNPMASIQSQVGLARDLLGLPDPPADCPAQLLQCIDETDRQVQRCTRIVQSLLRFSRRQKENISEIDVHEAIDQALTFVGTLPKMQRMELVHEVGPPVPALANLESVTQILVNLLINAADATRRQGRVVIEVRVTAMGRSAIVVHDNGDGIAPEVLERIFEPFFTTKPASQGTGLGLSISYGIAQSLGGDLTLQSAPTGGTIATLTLPAAEVTTTSPAEQLARA